MNKNIQDQFILLAEQAHLDGDNKLAAVLATVYGCYSHGTLSELFDAITRYLGTGAATQLVDLVAEGIKAKEESH